MIERRALIAPVALAGMLLRLIAALYIVDPAKRLPSFLPGHQAHSARRHTVRGVGAAAFAVGLFVLAWTETVRDTTTGAR